MDNQINLTWIIREINRYRKYSLYIQPTLFGTFDLIRSWGRIGRHSRRKYENYPTIEEAQLAMDRIIKQKKNKGYIMSEEQTSSNILRYG